MWCPRPLTAPLSRPLCLVQIVSRHTHCRQGLSSNNHLAAPASSDLGLCSEGRLRDHFSNERVLSRGVHDWHQLARIRRSASAAEIGPDLKRERPVGGDGRPEVWRHGDDLGHRGDGGTPPLQAHDHPSHLGVFRGPAGESHQRTDVTSRQAEILKALDAPEPTRFLALRAAPRSAA